MSQDREPYDPRQPFDADKLLDGFTVTEGTLTIDPANIIGVTLDAPDDD